MTGKIKD